MAVNLNIPTLGDKFQDYRQDIPGDSFSWGPAITTSKINAFTFHHSVTKQTAKNDGNWKKECDTIANLHLNRGWAGVGYRFIICSDGTVAYVGDLGRGGSAVADHNDHMFSACFVGDFTKELPTAAQVHSAHLLAKHFLTQMPQYPNLANWDQIKGHQDWNPTACPGSNWRTESGLRDRILNDHFDGYPDPQPAGVTPVPEPTPEPTPPPSECEIKLAEKEKKVGELEEQLKKEKTVIDNLNQQINDRNNDIIQRDGEISTLKTQVTDLTLRVESLSEQAKKVPDLEKIVEQAELNKESWAKERESLTKSNAQLKNTSYLTAPTKVLFQEVVKRVLHL